MEELGERLAGLMRAGDLVILNGPLGAGKTVLARGVGAGLKVQGPVISPTFVLVRVHPSSIGGPALVHVDAYRLGAPAEIDDLDLDSALADAVTLIEWGAGLAERLSDDRLEVVIERADDPMDDTRLVQLRPVGQRWREVDWSTLVDPAPMTEASRG
jgi:tRNA threonylcarbamoyladenosine biosynthesis protein TsaE